MQCTAPACAAVMKTKTTIKQILVLSADKVKGTVYTRYKLY